MYAEFSTLNISNCLFWRNGGHPTDGYAHYNYYSTMTATNCTYAGNGIWNDHATLTLTNSISAPLSGWYSDWPVTSYLSTVTVTNSCITAGQSPWPGTGNINADPRFSDPSSGDFRLLENSPCVGAGSNAALPTDVITDLDGNPRVYGAFVDMGAFEVQVDTLPPVIQAPNEVRIYANNTTGMNVSFTVQATDGFDGPVPVTCSPASGTFFPIGSTTVTCTAVDSQGRQAQSTFLVKVLYCWSGFYEPEPDGLASYQSGSPVRIRFQLLQESAAITNLAAQFVVIPNGGGGQFSYIRYARGINKEYVAVWDTTGVPPGEYLIDVVLGDGELRNVTVRVW